MTWPQVQGITAWMFILFAVLYLLFRVLLHLYGSRHRQVGRTLSGRGDKPAFLFFFGALLFLVGSEFFHLRVSSVSIAGMVLVGVALGLRAEALRQLARFYSEAIVIFENHRVVSTGVYRFLRHPLHLSLMIEASGLAMLSRSIFSIPFLFAIVVVVIWRNVREERLLIEALGGQYRRYLTSSAWDVIDLLPPTWRSPSACRSQETQ